MAVETYTAQIVHHYKSGNEPKNEIKNLIANLIRRNELRGSSIIRYIIEDKKRHYAIIFGNSIEETVGLLNHFYSSFLSAQIL